MDECQHSTKVKQLPDIDGQVLIRCSECGRVVDSYVQGRSCNECRKQAQLSCVYGMAGSQRTFDHPEIAMRCKSFSGRRGRKKERR